MSLVIARGASAASGETWTPTKQNNSTLPTISVDTQTLVGRNTAGTGSIEELTPAVARTVLGLGAMALNALSVLSSTGVNVTHTGAGTGVALVFTAVGAPTLPLTAGKWLVVGVVNARMNDVPGEAKLEFSDSAGANAFGAGISGLLATNRQACTVIGYKSVPSGTFNVYFKGSPIAGSTIDFGSADASAYAGALYAFRLEGA